MRIAVTGATGNVGSSLLPLLAGRPEVEEVVGIARRRPDLELEGVRWVAADVARDDLLPHLRGADALVHLAWAIQPSHRLGELRAINVEGSRRTFRAALEAGVGHLVHASSIGAYSPSPATPPGRSENRVAGPHRVDEAHPVGGVLTSFYSRHKAEVERLLDGLERERPDVRVVRLRPALIFKRDAATGIRRLFLGPLFPGSALRLPVPLVPFPEDLRLQALHTDDAAEAYRLAVLSEVRGPFNLAAEPVLDAVEVARLLGGRPLELPASLFRSATEATWRLRLQPTSTGWMDLARLVPLLDWTRARVELGWEPRHEATWALSELLAGLRSGADHPTPPLAKATTSPLRMGEVLTGVGARSGVVDERRPAGSASRAV